MMHRLVGVALLCTTAECNAVLPNAKSPNAKSIELEFQFEFRSSKTKRHHHPSGNLETVSLLKTPSPCLCGVTTASGLAQLHR